MLEPIVDDIESVSICLNPSKCHDGVGILLGNGYPFMVNGEVRHFRGSVSIVSADNPASAALGGFKQSASAFRFCRHCMGTEQDIQSQVCTSWLVASVYT